MRPAVLGIQKLPTSRRARITIAALVAGCMATIGLAAIGYTSTSVGVQFVQAGHWVYNDASESAVHINGASSQVDARVVVPGADRGSQVIQNNHSGFVVGRTRITAFDKSTLSVEDSRNAPAAERPVVLEVAGGPYLVYRNAGQVVRLGDPTATVRAGGPLSRPTATDDGTIWLHRIDSGALCKLTSTATRLVCPAQLSQGHSGALAVVGDRPVLLDTTSDTLRVVGDRGLGEAITTGVDLPASIKVASGTAAGRLAVVDPERPRLLLIDTAGIHKRPAAKPIEIDLPKEGQFTEPVTASNVVALVDQIANELLIYDGHGERRDRMTLPRSGGLSELRRGEDNRIYVDSPDGSLVLVVNGKSGSIADVRVGGEVSHEPTPGTTDTTPTSAAPSRRSDTVPTGSAPRPSVEPTPLALPTVEILNLGKDGRSGFVTVKADGKGLPATCRGTLLTGRNSKDLFGPVPCDGITKIQTKGYSFLSVSIFVVISNPVGSRTDTWTGTWTPDGATPTSATPSPQPSPIATPTALAALPIVEILGVGKVGFFTEVVTVKANGRGLPATCRGTVTSSGSTSHQTFGPVPCDGLTEIETEGYLPTTEDWSIHAIITTPVASRTDTWTGRVSTN